MRLTVLIDVVPPRNSTARSGGIVFTNMPVACSKPASTPRRGVISMYQRGAVCTTRLYGGCSTTRPSETSASRGRDRDGRDLARRWRRRSVVPASAWQTRTRSGDVDANGHHTVTSPSAITSSGRARGRCRRRADRRASPSCRSIAARDRGRHEVEREDLRVRVRDRRARGAALVEDRGGVRRARRRGARATRSRSTVSTSAACVVVELGERAVVVGREHDRPRGAVVDDGVEVREHPHPPARRRRARRRRCARPRAGSRLVAGAERAVLGAAVLVGRRRHERVRAAPRARRRRSRRGRSARRGAARALTNSGYVGRWTRPFRS